MTKLLRFFRPSHQHTAFSATLLLITAVMMSRVIGYARDAYIAYAYGAGGATDAYVAAFTLPDFLNYIVAGGAASITFISIYTRFLAEKREEDAQKTFSIIITVMTAVMIVGTIITEIFAPQFIRWFVKGFSPDKIDLCVHLTRILLPAQIFFYVGGVVSAVLLSHRLFLFPAFGPLIYNLFIILGGVVGGKHFGIASLAYGALVGSFAGPFLASVIGAMRVGPGYRPSFDISNPAFREWVKLSVPLMLGVSLVTADDWILRHYAASGVGDIARLNYAKRLFAVPIAVLGQATGQASLPFFARLFSEKKLKEFATTVNDSVYRVSAASFLASGWMMAAAAAADRPGLSAGKVFVRRHPDQRDLFFLVLALSGAVVRAGSLRARLLCRRRHDNPNDRGHCHYARVASGLLDLVSRLWRRGPGVGLRHRNWRQSGGPRWTAALSKAGPDRRFALERTGESRHHRRDRGRDQFRSGEGGAAIGHRPRQPPGRCEATGARFADLGSGCGSGPIPPALRTAARSAAAQRCGLSSGGAGREQRDFRSGKVELFGCHANQPVYRLVV